MLPSVYLETTVVSYLAARPSMDPLIADYQQITRDWWRTAAQHFTLFASELVVLEISAGDPYAARDRLALLGGVKLLDPSAAADRLTKQLLDHGAVPRKAAEDAVHIAIAATNGVDYLVTWNLKHIANEAQRSKIERGCLELGYIPAKIRTPKGLMEEHYGGTRN